MTGSSSTFALGATGAVKLGNVNGITTAPTASGNVQTSVRTFPATSTYIYSGTANQVTGNANFEVEIAPGRNFSIEVQVGNEKVEYFPLSIYSNNLFDSRFNPSKCVGSIWFKGSFKNGQKKELGIHREHLRDRSGNQIEDLKLQIKLGSRGRGISISKEELSKLFDKIFSNELKFVGVVESKTFSELSQNEQERMRRFKNQVIS
jgi:hypothetical protein